MNNRPLSIAHLVFGLIFLGAAGLWVIGAGTDADSGDIARLVPAVLIGAGVIGLIAIMVNARNGRRPAVTSAETPSEAPAWTSAETPTQSTTEPDTDDPAYADTAVLDHEEKK